MDNQSRKVIRAIIAFISCICMIGNVHAQNLAFKVPPKKTPVDQRESNKISLVEILDRIEQNYNVTFAYQKKILSGKSAEYRALFHEDLETYLKEILGPHQLEFKRIENIKEVIYIIARQEKNNDLIKPFKC